PLFAAQRRGLIRTLQRCWMPPPSRLTKPSSRCRSPKPGAAATPTRFSRPRQRMPSELQRVAEQLLACLNEAPRAGGYLQDRARKCREAAAWIGSTSNNPSARIAATQLDEAARRCEEAAHYLSQAEARAKQWVEQMVSGIRTAGPDGGSRDARSPGTGGRTP